ncbi:MAG: MiaB/RimO family radical SAM methylthiotransferase [Candidatus Omnitrophica bacterium]|nr:MiaB/RimO family radical SAM methylthiotransferase [Candidatus Omnitrophota bacterium]MBU4303476.1 MiaB/RimO family radical SAM methylthiotransferase [Candidatus Omnitrophota bacterium]MBU4467463.1 MiaB/RimO family radical SAM methylthiotransferase [Candidatus Omnitrophota bacterium]MCG2708558.1 MiaB/RimO family radical SAM methylthiotransferase [Candidatus Omnitrophota bacterium]
MKEKIGIITLGCPRNLVDAEALAGRLKFKDYSIVDDITQAEVVLVNTCAFIQEAKRESIDVILDLVQLKKQGKLKKIIVYGCLAQRYKNLAKDLPEVDAFVGTLGLNHESKRFALTPKHYAYLKICEGCVNQCSYCVIPKIKGSLESLDEPAIIRNVERFNRQKISELNIIGQDITGFGMDTTGKSQLTGLLQKIISNAPDIGWIRLLYLHPERITSQLLKLIASSERICKYIDLPIQHINNRILKAMHRPMAKEEIMALIKKIRKTIPGVYLRTSLIVGFPSETEKEFSELLEFVKEAKFDRLGAFIYSREEGTPAYNFKGQISLQLKQERFDKIMSAQREIAAGINAKFLGKNITVLVEEKQDGAYIGRSQGDAPEVDGVVYINTTGPLEIGKFIQVKITDTLEYDLVGEKI